ncbi:hypothetical protein BIZ36_13910, partial [Cytophaga sp. FL35]|nr:hypothetical protein [Cytophaga sp. FL35]
MTTPVGADVGDVYVNTDTGTIYFWDGDSWELTSSDDQQLQAFTFDNTTGELSLTLENGGTASVFLPIETITTLSNTLPIGNAIGEYENENGDVVIINETITTISDTGDGNVTFTNEEGNSITVAKSDITDLGGGLYQFTNGDGTDVTIDTNGMSISNVIVGNRIATVTKADGTTTDIDETITSITDNGDGNVTLVNEAGNSITVAKSDIIDLGGGLYQFTNGDGTDVTIDTNGMSISNVIAGNRIATVTEADGTTTDVNETITDITGTSNSGNEIGVYQKEDGTTVSIQESIVNITDNGDGNVTLVNEAGNSITVAKSDITDLGGGLYQFTNGDGTDVTIDTNGMSISNVIAGNRIATVTEADGTTTDIDETITSITDNGDGNVTFTNEAGNSITVAKSDITDLGGGLYQFTNGDGTDVTIDTNGMSISNVIAG